MSVLVTLCTSLQRSATCGQGEGHGAQNPSGHMLPGVPRHVLVWGQSDGFVKAL